MGRPRVDSEGFAAGRREAREALDSLLDLIRDSRIEFGKAALELTIHDAVFTHKRTTIERTQRFSAAK